MVLQPHPKLLRVPTKGQSEYQHIDSADAGWEHLGFGARRLRQTQCWMGTTGDCEFGFVILGGVCRIESPKGNWPRVGRRPNVFAGMPYGLYLPPNSDFAVTSLSEELDIAYGWCRAKSAHPARLVRPEESNIEIRGGGSATRQINSIFPPGFPCDRLVAVEVYTPAGNWSSFPPHKHDVHRVDERGQILEADLEEVYFYKLDRPEGFATQRVYTSDGRLDETVTARNDEVVLIPEGYHPVASPPGYTTYYLNFLAGTAQSLANSDDPEHAWIKRTWNERDPRLPLVSLSMENP